MTNVLMRARQLTLTVDKIIANTGAGVNAAESATEAVTHGRRWRRQHLREVAFAMIELTGRTED